MYCIIVQHSSKETEKMLLAMQEIPSMWKNCAAGTAANRSDDWDDWVPNGC